ncbi:dienelactone hydrolase family protein [Kitasatospora sp. NA04385]|uniref:dienelactone hydrolase family protein n=1 Tax=Kitasatospora sp. NA04385 TaxID=2742135 RepID=UPI0015909A61|nr:dienelactone hydrolase family protein [Kitasatospora sp. NA04385]QKW23370.1 dienelactone hydrolase family protein [Kitasatospora sp. NA04385]
MSTADVTTRWVRPQEGGPELFLAAPADAAPAATVVVGQELFGVTAWVRGVCERLAAAGYAAVAPDFYGRKAARVELPYDDAGRAEGFALLGTLTAEQVAADTAAALALGASLSGGPGRAFAGFSVGGHLGLLAGTRLPLDLVAACYPTWTLEDTPLADDHPPLGEQGAAALAAHGTTVLGLVGAEDHVVPPEQWDRITERLTAAGVGHELVTYAGVPHGFLCEDRPATHRPEETADAFARILAALAALATLSPKN